MVKRILIGLVIISIISLVVTSLSLGSIVKSGITKYGTELLGTPISVSSVYLSPFSGSGSINGIVIQNPEGFSQEVPMLSVDSIDFHVNISSLFADTIIIHTLHIDKYEITHERGLSGSNLTAIEKYMAKNAPPPTAADEEPAQAEGARTAVIIEDLQVLNGKVRTGLSAANAVFTIPDVRAQNIGSGENRFTFAEAVELGVSSLALTLANPKALARGVLSAGKSVIDIGEGTVSVGGDIIKGTGRGVGQLLEGGGDAIKVLIGQ